MSKRLYFSLIGLGSFIALGGVGLQVWNASNRQAIRTEKGVVDGVQVCKLAKDWQDIMREQHPHADRKLPELQSIAGVCPSLEH